MPSLLLCCVLSQLLQTDSYVVEAEIDENLAAKDFFIRIDQINPAEPVYVTLQREGGMYLKAEQLGNNKDIQLEHAKVEPYGDANAIVLRVKADSGSKVPDGIDANRNAEVLTVEAPHEIFVETSPSQPQFNNQASFYFRVNPIPLKSDSNVVMAQYTLQHPIPNEGNIALGISFDRKSPKDALTYSGYEGTSNDESISFPRSKIELPRGTRLTSRFTWYATYGAKPQGSQGKNWFSQWVESERPVIMIAGKWKK